MDAEHEGRFQQKMVDRVGKELALDDAQRQLLVALAERLQARRKALLGTGADPGLRAVLALPRGAPSPAPAHPVARRAGRGLRMRARCRTAAPRRAADA